MGVEPRSESPVMSRSCKLLVSLVLALAAAGIYVIAWATCRPDKFGFPTGACGAVFNMAAYVLLVGSCWISPMRAGYRWLVVREYGVYRFVTCAAAAFVMLGVMNAIIFSINLLSV